MIGDSKPREDDEIQITAAMTDFTPFGGKMKAKKRKNTPQFDGDLEDI